MDSLLKLIRENLDFSLNITNISSCLLKEITASSSIAVQKPGHGYHIEVTDMQGAMNFFPIVTSAKYLEHKSSQDKRVYQLKIHLKISKNNLNALLSSLQTRKNDFTLKYSQDEITRKKDQLEGCDDLIDSYTIGSFNIRGAGQAQSEIGTSYDDDYFIQLRHTILPNDYLLFVKSKNDINYNVYGVTQSQVNILEYFKGETKYISFTPDKSYVDTYDIIEASTVDSSPAENKIYFGAPGTGKSYTIAQQLSGISEQQIEQIVFHPEFDYASFIGGYRPAMDGKVIKYEFVPQAFTNIYVKAWNNLDQKYYLVIEEINRGNCAEIFGDIFQLLDRNSKYKLSPSKELREYLERELTNPENGLCEGKLLLPNNLNILATMNTSDQSLFPMDSAFKRRWDWEYIPINYEALNEDDSPNHSYDFIVKIDESTSFKWNDFIFKVNTTIKENPNLGMDKCIGNYFINAKENNIELKHFISKAIFYLWNDVFKDEEESIFENHISYEDFFPESNGILQVKSLIEGLNVDIIGTPLSEE